VGALLATSSPARPAPSATRRARVAVRYIANQQEPDGSIPAFSPVGSTADAIVSMVAARRGPQQIEAALGYLQDNQADIDTMGERGKVAMAAVAGGHNPRAFAGRNLIAEIRSAQTTSGRFGVGTEVFNHALAMLGVAAADGRLGDAAKWLADAQCRDGGWQFDHPARPSDNRHCFTGDSDFVTSDTNTTSLAVMALELTGPRERLKRSPFEYFASARDEVKRGYRFSHRERGFGARVFSDANSTALVLQAFEARDKKAPAGARRALNHLQYRLCGPRAGAYAFTWERKNGRLRKTSRNVGATIAAIPALVRKPFPIGSADVTEPPPTPGAC
jgi:hypothetical protein